MKKKINIKVSLKFNVKQLILIFLLVAAAIFLYFILRKQPVTLDIPLAEGNKWEYSSVIKRKALGKEISSPPFNHFIELTGTEDVKGIRCFRLEGRIENELVAFLYLTRESDGIYQVLADSGKKEIIIKKDALRGDSWEFSFFNDTITMKVDGFDKKKTVPAGTVECNKLKFTGANKDNNIRGTVWLNNQIGIIAMEYTYRADHYDASTVIELTKYELK
ncbi:MAG: hypothetical protein M1536_02235 [Firmicutes bacterium]|nr:hypothetical protein [Bacillota bacterium]